MFNNINKKPILTQNKYQMLKSNIKMIFLLFLFFFITLDLNNSERILKKKNLIKKNNSERILHFRFNEVKKLTAT